MIPDTTFRDTCARNVCEPGLRPGLALIFDLDGVIVNSNPLHCATWRNYAAARGIELEDDFYEWMYGKRNDEIVIRVFGPTLGEAEIARHGAEKERQYRQLMKPVLEEHLIRGIRAFLERHAAAPKAVATNGEKANLEFVLRESALERHFRVVLHGGQVRRPKPDAEIYLCAAAALGVAPRNCIVFEDSRAGVEAARSAGMRVAGVLSTHAELREVHVGVMDFADPALEFWLLSQRPI